MFLPRRFVWLSAVFAPVLAAAWASGPSDAKRDVKLMELDLGGGAKMEFLRISKGKFSMGSPKNEDGRSNDEELHDVEIAPDFYLGKYEVTRGQFRVFVESEKYKADAEKDGLGGSGYDEEIGKFKGPTWDAKTGKHNGGTATNYTWRDAGFEQTDEHPAVNVSWNDATAFCRWLARKSGRKIRLPSEAEWEYSCRAGTRTRFYNGNDAEKLVRVGNVADGTAKEKFSGWTTIDAEDGYAFTAPVGRFEANRFGLCDMHGNVWEWCLDWYAPYERAESSGAALPSRARKRAGLSASLSDGRRSDWLAVSYEGLAVKNPIRLEKYDYESRVLRSGSWADRPGRCRSATRRGLPPLHRCHHVGFRVAFRMEE